MPPLNFNINVSVIIPAFNRTKLLLRAVSSVLSQTYRDFELIVVDDGSTENLSEVSKLVAENGHIFISTENCGVASARNFGASISSGNWLAFLDSDDKWLPTKLEEQIKFSESFPKTKIFHCNESWFRNSQQVSPKIDFKPAQGKCFFDSVKFCNISASAVFLERAFFEKLGGFDEEMAICEDYDFWIRASLESEVRLLEKFLVEKYRLKENQLSSSQPAIDRFRVYSLVKILLKEVLNSERRKAILEQISLKSEILSKGAKKRNNEISFQTFNETQKIAQRFLTNVFDFEIIRKDFSLIFPKLLAEIEPRKFD
ncbi:MAG: glycosyltransferase [Calditrichaeota bacterium]|nr:MAG: glycosyltransferase [Calditrichota bacterium]